MTKDGCKHISDTNDHNRNTTSGSVVGANQFEKSFDGSSNLFGSFLGITCLNRNIPFEMKVNSIFFRVKTIIMRK